MNDKANESVSSLRWKWEKLRASVVDNKLQAAGESR